MFSFVAGKEKCENFGSSVSIVNRVDWKMACLYILWSEQIVIRIRELKIIKNQVDKIDKISIILN